MSITSDQATGLRGDSQQPPASTPAQPLLRKLLNIHTIAIASGKGGVGKTHITANLAIVAAQRSQRVVLLDADLGLASLDLALGVRAERDLQAVVDGQCQASEILVEGPCGVRLVPACPGRYEMANLNGAQRQRLLEALNSVASSFDLMLIDTGAGLSANAVSFAFAEQVILVATPDPTSLRDVYAMAKVLHLRGGVPRLSFLANRVSSQTEGYDLYDQLAHIIRRFLPLELHYLGAVPEDAAVRQAVAMGEPYVLAAPESPASRAIHHIVDRLELLQQPKPLC